MKHVNFDTESRPATVADKTNVAREIIGLADGKSANRAPKFHSMHIASAENGSILDHVKKTNPTGPDKTTKIVIPHDHPMHQHIQALHDHAEDCSG